MMCEGLFDLKKRVARIRTQCLVHTNYSHTLYQLSYNPSLYHRFLSRTHTSFEFIHIMQIVNQRESAWNPRYFLRSSVISLSRQKL